MGAVDIPKPCICHVPDRSLPTIVDFYVLLLLIIRWRQRTCSQDVECGVRQRYLSSSSHTSGLLTRHFSPKALSANRPRIRYVIRVVVSWHKAFYRAFLRWLFQMSTVDTPRAADPRPPEALPLLRLILARPSSPAAVITTNTICR